VNARVGRGAEGGAPSSIGRTIFDIKMKDTGRTKEEVNELAGGSQDLVPTYVDQTWTDTRDLGRKQSSWHFILPSTIEVEGIKRQVMFWAKRIEFWAEMIKGDVGDEVRGGISFGLIGEEGCDCGI